MILFHPHERVIKNKPPYLSAAIVRSGAPPGCLGAVIVIKINATHTVFLPAVKLPEIQVARSEMVVNHVQNNRNASPVQLAHKHLEAVWTTIDTLNSKYIRRIVTPGVVARKFRDGHNLDRIYAKPFQMPYSLHRSIKIPRFTLRIRKKRTDVHLIDYQFIVRRQLKIVVLPIKTGCVVNDSIACGISDLPGVWVNPRQLLVTVDQHKFIFVPWFCRFHICVPIPVFFMGQGCCPLGPAVELAHYIDRLSVRRPDSKGNPVFMDDRPHSLMNLSRFIFEHIPCLL